MTNQQRTNRYARRLVEWSDANPYKPRLAASLSALGGKYRPTSAAEDRIIMAEEAEVSRLRDGATADGDRLARGPFAARKFPK